MVEICRRPCRSRGMAAIALIACWYVRRRLGLRILRGEAAAVTSRAIGSGGGANHVVVHRCHANRDRGERNADRVAGIA